MDVADPITTLIPRPEGPVLRVLAHAERPMTGRAVARLAALSQSTAARTLRRLVEGGLVLHEGRRPVSLYRLNHDHLAAPAVLIAAGLREAMHERIREHVARWPIQPVNVTLFGSAARGDGTPRSDIDLLVVRPDAVRATSRLWTKSVAGLCDALARATGNDPQPIEYSESELVEGWADGSPFVAEVARTGIPLVGVPLPRIIEEAGVVPRDSDSGRAAARLVTRSATEYLAVARAAFETGAWNAATSNAATAGILAKDALCYLDHGSTIRAKDHAEAVRELKAVAGQEAAHALNELIKIKPKAQYDAKPLTRGQATSAMRRAERLFELAAAAMRSAEGAG